MDGPSKLKFIDGIYKKPLEAKKISPQKPLRPQIFKFLVVFFLIFLFSIPAIRLYLSYPDISGKISQAKSSTKTAIKIVGFGQELLGKKEEKKYLLLFQNSAEARPSGGFLGNYGLLTLKSGKVKNLKIDDIYALKWEYLDGKNLLFPSYTPLNFIGPDFGIQEGNWNVDFTTSAVRMEGLYKQYTGEKLDGVIAVDPKLFEDILEILGAIEMQEYDLALNHKNFREQIQYKVEVDNPFKRGNPKANPKKILKDFTSIFLEKVKNASFGQKIEILKKIVQNLAEKHILLYSENPQVQNLLSDLNWSGEIKDYSRDFLFVVNSNISATKSSLKIEEKIDLTINILSDGTIINEVEISHDGKNLSGLLAGRDKSFIQILVPQGSELIGAEYGNKKIPKNKIYKFSEDSKTVFAFDDFLVLPGQKKKVIFRYKLPFKINKSSAFYSLLIQKQPGTIANDFQITINLAENLKIKENTPADLEISSDGIKYLNNLETDKFLSLVFEFDN